MFYEEMRKNLWLKKGYSAFFFLLVLFRAEKSLIYSDPCKIFLECMLSFIRIGVITNPNKFLKNISVVSKKSL